MYIVYNKTTGGRPTVTHGCRELADAEAKRLAKANPGHTFCVFECQGSYYRDPMPTFGDLRVGDKFKHDGRVLIKTHPIDAVATCGGYRVRTNAIRLAPQGVAGLRSQFRDDTYIERV